MAAIAAGDVTYALQEGTQYAGPSDPMKCANYSITFGDGSDTYPSGGVPLTKGKLGCPNRIVELVVIEADADDGYLYKYDESAETIRAYEVPALDGNAAAVQALSELTTSATPAATTLIVKVKGW